MILRPGLEALDYNSVKERQKIEFIGYEVSNAQLKERSTHHFIFDSFCKTHLEALYADNQPFHFILLSKAFSAVYIFENRDVLLVGKVFIKEEKYHLILT